MADICIFIALIPLKEATIGCHASNIFKGEALLAYISNIIIEFIIQHQLFPYDFLIYFSFLPAMSSGRVVVNAA